MVLLKKLGIEWSYHLISHGGKFFLYNQSIPTTTINMYVGATRERTDHILVELTNAKAVVKPNRKPYFQKQGPFLQYNALKNNYCPPQLNDP